MQKTFSELEYTGKKKQTRRDRFLADLEQLVPWAHLEAQVAPFYSNTAGKRGRPAIGVSRMLRMYVVQQCFGFSDEGCEDAVYDSQAIRGFMGIDLGRESAPDATTLLRFRRLLEANQLTRLLFETINQHLASRGLLLKEGTIVDATLIAAPPSVKNREGKRDPEMHQARKGNQWHFGMKAHIGVDATSGLVHSVVGTAANVADVTQVGQLLHGDETYCGVLQETHKTTCPMLLLREQRNPESRPLFCASEMASDSGYRFQGSTRLRPPDPSR
ncbi:transposase [Pseudomonas syringae pv. cerasicola]|nr:transposase [Pseudomonas syringae pv. cerasicola]SPF16199.1 transposase [Pseudomonas syringae pv. cerasicola]